jgi:hypothetical protein
MTQGVASAILGAFASMLSARVLWLMVWPVLVSLAFWGVVALFLWMRAAVWLAGLLKQWIETAAFFVSFDFGSTALVASHVILFLFFVPLVYMTALLILGTFGMDELVNIVADKRFPALKKREGGSFAGSLWNSGVAVLGMLLMFAVSLPLWIFPPLWPVIPVAVMGWMNQRVLRYDALARHAQPLEMAEIFGRRRMALYALGVVLALLAYVPVFGFFAPVFFGLVFIHFLLAELQALRVAPIEGVVTGRE